MHGLTLIELLIVVALLGVSAAIAVPIYRSHIEEANLSSVRADFARIEAQIERYRTNASGSLPMALADMGINPVDPWGNPYRYFNIEDAPPGTGNLRKDKNLNPLNSDFDLYSIGRDGQTQLPLTPPVSHDDVIRANNGAFIGYAQDF